MFLSNFNGFSSTEFKVRIGIGEGGVFQIFCFMEQLVCQRLSLSVFPDRILLFPEECRQLPHPTLLEYDPLFFPLYNVFLRTVVIEIMSITSIYHVKIISINRNLVLIHTWCIIVHHWGHYCCWILKRSPLTQMGVSMKWRTLLSDLRSINYNCRRKLVKKKDWAVDMDDGVLGATNWAMIFHRSEIVLEVSSKIYFRWSLKLKTFPPLAIN